MTDDGTRVECLVGARVAEVIDALARLRIAVFSEWPYLYDGDADYEARYLARYAATPEAIVVTARDDAGRDASADAASGPEDGAGRGSGNRARDGGDGADRARALVGAATGMPLAAHDEAIVAAVSASRLPVAETFYCAESVLLPAWRGRGLGHRFFDERERHARALGYRYACFCAVQRPDDHPARPAAARSLAPFWRGRGYRPLESSGGSTAGDTVVARLAWRDHGEAEETEKPLAFWWRALDD